MIPEKLTDRARKAIALADVESKRLGHNYVGTEHLMISILRAEGVAAFALRKMGVDLDRAIVAIKDAFGDTTSGDATPVEPNTIGQTALINRALYCIHEAREITETQLVGVVPRNIDSLRWVSSAATDLYTAKNCLENLQRGIEAMAGKDTP